ncbi:formylglycine-generating enzyme family protein [Sorangium sp. So ce693]|uniref:formylglycine-generating enzyme family protein n=1 Tax=Sorangium sp. So ce693 TaxID=3133318 RepID=UPI003F64760F
MLGRRAGWWWGALAFVASGCGTLVGLGDDYIPDDRSAAATGSTGGAGAGDGTATRSSGDTDTNSAGGIGGGATSTSAAGGGAPGGDPPSTSSTAATSSSSTTAGGGGCSTGERRCDDKTPQRCNGGEWESSAPCAGSLPLCSVGTCTDRPSCGGLPETCGPEGNERCCATMAVPGGTFDRGNDITFPATVSGFELDRFEVTVGRFRRFVDAYPESRPTAGAGAHPEIVGSGWNSAWDEANLPRDPAVFRSAIRCTSSYSTWTDAPDANERLPMNCITWYVAFAFCAWDGGRLPTEAEWNYAAAGGSEQRVYPWSAPPSSTTLDVDHAAHDCLPGGPTLCMYTHMKTVGSKSPLGDGRWGHADLAGNMSEWTLDSYLGYPTPCTDCAQLAAHGQRIIRGGGWNDESSRLTTSSRGHYPANDNGRAIGFRCVRTP